MKLLKSIQYSALLLFIFLLFGCKDSNTVQPPVNNNGNPNSPALLSPPNEATIRDLQPILEWQSFNGAVTYHIQVSLDANFNGTMLMDSTGITATHVTLTTGLGSTGSYYYWRVIANITGGTSPWSPTFRFRTIENPPSAPNLLAPLNGSVNQSFLPFFDWDEPATAQIYRLQVSVNQNFQTHLIDTSVSTSQIQCPYFVLNTGALYYWRVNASNSGGLSTSGWSASYSFTTVSGPSPSTISGQVTFTDSSFVQPMLHRYFIGAYNSWPPADNSLSYSRELNIQLSGGTYSSTYQLSRVSDGPYVLAVYYIPNLNQQNIPILGIYGCDTVHIQYSNCANNPTQVIMANGNGLESRNILSWADTTSRVH